MALSLDNHLAEAFRLTLWSRHVCLHTNSKHCHCQSNSEAFDVVFTEMEIKEVKERTEVVKGLEEILRQGKGNILFS